MTRFNMVLSAALSIIAMSALAPPARAEIQYPWCAQLSEDGGGGARTCGYDSFEQCLATISGIGGYCERNLLYPGPASQQPQPVRKRSNRN